MASQVITEIVRKQINNEMKIQWPTAAAKITGH